MLEKVLENVIEKWEKDLKLLDEIDNLSDDVRELLLYESGDHNKPNYVFFSHTGLLEQGYLSSRLSEGSLKSAGFKFIVDGIQKKGFEKVKLRGFHNLDDVEKVNYAMDEIIDLDKTYEASRQQIAKEEGIDLSKDTFSTAYAFAAVQHKKEYRPLVRSTLEKIKLVQKKMDQYQK